PSPAYQIGSRCTSHRVSRSLRPIRTSFPSRLFQILREASLPHRRNELAETAVRSLRVLQYRAPAPSALHFSAPTREPRYTKAFAPTNSSRRRASHKPFQVQPSRTPSNGVAFSTFRL